MGRTRTNWHRRLGQKDPKKPALPSSEPGEDWGSFQNQPHREHVSHREAGVREAVPGRDLAEPEMRVRGMIAEAHTEEEDVREAVMAWACLPQPEPMASTLGTGMGTRCS
jgi:hypothetical protein